MLAITCLTGSKVLAAVLQMVYDSVVMGLQEFQIRGPYYLEAQGNHGFIMAITTRLQGP